MNELSFSPGIEERISSWQKGELEESLDQGKGGWKLLDTLSSLPESVQVCKVTPSHFEVLRSQKKLLGGGSRSKIFSADLILIDREDRRSCFPNKKVAKVFNTDVQEGMRLHEKVHSLIESLVASPPEPVKGADSIYIQDFYPSDLRKTFFQNGNLPLAKQLDIAIGIAEAVAAVHAAGCYHHNIDFPSFLVEGDNDIHVKINEFDLCRQIDFGCRKGDAYYHPALSTCSQHGFRDTVADDIFMLGFALMQIFCPNLFDIYAVREYLGHTPEVIKKIVLHRVCDNYSPMLMFMQGRMKELQPLMQVVRKILIPILIADKKLATCLSDSYYIDYCGKEVDVDGFTRMFSQLSAKYLAGINKTALEEMLQEFNLTAKEVLGDPEFFCTRKVEAVQEDMSLGSIKEKADELFPSAKEIVDFLKTLKEEEGSASNSLPIAAYC